MVKGIDVASWEADTNIKDYADKGYKVNYIKLTQGTKYVNPCAYKQYQDSKNCGMDIGFYHFADSDNDIQGEIQHFKDVLQHFNYNLKICLDIEAGFKGNADNFIQAWINEFGKDNIIVYTGLSFYHEFINVVGYDIWIAAYGQNKPSITQCNMLGWQYTDSPIDLSEWNTVPYIGSPVINNIKEVKQEDNAKYKYGEMFVEMKTFINGKTKENIWASNEHKNLVGYLDPYEKCRCLGIHESGHMIVLYTGSNGYDKVGLTESKYWDGCIK